MPNFAIERESAAERKVVQWAERHGVDWIKLKKAGWPDRMFCIAGGAPVLIEFKRVQERLRKLQDHVTRRLRAVGYDVIRCDDGDEGIAYLKQRILEAKRL